MTDSPLICDDEGGGVIDPVHFNDGSQNWIIWKVDGNALGGATSCTGGEKSDEYKPTWIKIQRVSKDGLSLEGDATNIYNNAGKADDGVVEGPAMYKRRPGSYVSSIPGSGNPSIPPFLGPRPLQVSLINGGR